MHPYHPQHTYYYQQQQQQQSTGFNPPPQPPPTAPPPPPQHHGFRQVQYQQQRPAQHPHQYAPQRYAPQQHPGPVPYSPPTAYSSYAPPPPAVVPPARAHSQSPDKAGRPLPAPAATVTPARSRPMSMPPAPVARPYAMAYTHANPPASSFAGRPAFQPQPQPQPQPPSPLPPHMPHSQSSPVIRTPPQSPPSKRPLPAPPGGATPTSPPITPSHAPGATPPSRGRTLPFSPTNPPSAEEGIKSGRKVIVPPQRSSTLPSPISPISNGVVDRMLDKGKPPEPPFPSRPSMQNTPPSLDKGKAPVHTAFASRPSMQNIPSTLDKGKAPEHSPPPQSTPFTSRPSMQNIPSSFDKGKAPEHSPPSRPSPSSSFALPPRQRPTQSLAFQLASLSLREEQTRAKPKAPVVPPSRSPVRTTINLDDAPPTSTIRRPSFESKQASNARQPLIPTINVPDEDEEETAPSITLSRAPSISVSAAPSINVSEAPSINISEPPSINISEPSITISEAPSAPSITFSDAPPSTPTISTSSSIPDIIVADLEGTLDTSINAPAQPRRKGLICYGCGKGILGRIVSAMGGRWHPGCFKCTVCSELLEHVSSYEHAGKPYCHLDYHEKFAPQCYHCRTPIIDERFITLDDPGLGKRTYHEQHFFCAECGDPFLAPTIPGTGKDSEEDGGVVAQDDDVGFTVYKGHPYCEACHVRLRYPKCKRCRKSIRDGMQAVEALGGKWCWECFWCAGCEKPFEDPAFFQRGKKAYCEKCFSVIVKNEM